MSPPLLHSGSDHALEQACRDAEVLVSRVAKLVLHASALAARMEAMPVAADLRAAHQRSERVRVLRDAAEAGRRSITRAGSPPWPTTDVHPAQRGAGAPTADGRG